MKGFWSKEVSWQWWSCESLAGMTSICCSLGLFGCWAHFWKIKVYHWFPDWILRFWSRVLFISVCTQGASTSSVMILPLNQLISLKSFLYSSFFGGRTIKSFSKNSQRGCSFQNPLILLCFLFQMINIIWNLNKISLHSLSFHLNVKNILKMLPVSNWVECFFYLLFIEFNLFLNIF